MSAARVTGSVSEGPSLPRKPMCRCGVQRWTVNDSTRPFVRWQRARLDAERSAQWPPLRVRFSLPRYPCGRGRASTARTSGVAAPRAHSTPATTGSCAVHRRRARLAVLVFARSPVTVVARARAVAVRAAPPAIGATTALRVAQAGAATSGPAHNALNLPGREQHGLREIRRIDSPSWLRRLAAWARARSIASGCGCGGVAPGHRAGSNGRCA